MPKSPYDSILEIEMAYRLKILAYEGCMASEVMGIADLFHVANKLWSQRNPESSMKLFEIELIGVRDSSISTANGAHRGPRRARHEWRPVDRARA
jgi:hypothetical protein